MRRFYKILNGFALFLIVCAAALAFTVSYTKSCPEPIVVSFDSVTMRSVSAPCYGGPEVLAIQEVLLPDIAPDEMLVEVKAAAVIPLDWHYMRGSPYLMRLSSGIGSPNDSSTGVDFAGVVTKIGSQITKYAVGDRVFGGRSGAFAEFIVVREARLKTGMLTWKGPHCTI